MKDNTDLILDELRSSIFITCDQLEVLKNKKKLKQYEVQDMLDNLELLLALEKVYIYYGGEL